MLCSGMVFVESRYAFWIRCVKVLISVSMSSVFGRCLYLFCCIVLLRPFSQFVPFACLFSVMSVCSFTLTGKWLEGRSSID